MSKDKDLPVKEIKTLSQILKEEELTEIELEIGEMKIKVRKESLAQTNIVQPISNPAPALSPSPAPSQQLKEIKSPMVGTFYASSSPDAPAFIKLGDKIKKGDIICIVEAMKIMNELPSDQEGEVVEICVSNGQAIGYGQVIARIK